LSGRPPTDAQLSELLSQLGYDPATIKSLMDWAIGLTILSVVAAVPTGLIAKRKGRSVTGWVLLELCIPVVPLLVVWLLPAKKKPTEP
jgi:hypothetical protein